MASTFNSRAPTGVLAEHVEAFWQKSGSRRPDPAERALPTGTVELVVDLRHETTPPEPPGRLGSSVLYNTNGSRTGHSRCHGDRGSDRGAEPGDTRMSKINAYTPPGYRTMNPYLIVEGADRLFGFLERSFDGSVEDRTVEKDGSVRHGAVRIGDSMVELSEARPEWPAFPGAIHLYVPDTDSAYARAMENGAESLYEPADMAYGERSAGVKDPTGNCWYIATYLGGAGD